MLRPGLGPEEHVRQALKLPSSFGEVGLADLDVPFAAWTTAKLELSMHAWRHSQLRAITVLSRAVEPLQRALVRGMPVDVRERAEKWNIALIAAMVPLPRWPNRRLAVCSAEGVRTIGCVEPPSVFRPLAEPIEPVDGSTDSFLRGAAVLVVMNTFPNLCPCCGVDHKTRLQGEMKGHQSEPMDRAGMDRLFGTGRWRPMPLFALRQNNKDRFLADARRGGHSGYTSEQESLPFWRGDP